MNTLTDKTPQQIESDFISPMRSFSLTALDHYEQFLNIRMDVVRAYSDMVIAQARTWLDVKDSESFKKAVETQQKTVTDFMERVKEDTEKVTSITKNLAQDSLKKAEKTSKKALETAKK